MIRSIETNTYPAAGGSEDQSEQYRQGRIVVETAKAEVIQSIKKEEERRANRGRK